MGTTKLTDQKSISGDVLKGSKILKGPRYTSVVQNEHTTKNKIRDANLPKSDFQDTETSSTQTSEKESVKENAQKTSNMNSIGDLIGNASNIVLKAAGILEVEVARGILAAKQVEEKYGGMPKIRSGEITSNRQFDDLFGRFRKDAHDIIDLLVDFTAIAAQNANKVTNQFMKIGVGKSSSNTTVNKEVPLIQIPGVLKAGEQSSFPVTLENDNPKETRTINFINSPLTNSGGDQLVATSLTFDPNPLTLQPSSTGNVSVTIKIPADAKPGNYHCFVEAQNSESLRATVMVKVA